MKNMRFRTKAYGLPIDCELAECEASDYADSAEVMKMGQSQRF